GWSNQTSIPVAGLVKVRMAKRSRAKRNPTTAALRRAYKLMRARSGHRHWWPGETPFEVCVGAILTQNTAWTNVERAIANLKAGRLRSFLRVLVENFGGDLRKLFAGQTSVVRERLLAIVGIGPETADS